MRLLLSFLILVIILFIVFSPSVPTIRRYFSRKTREFDEHYRDPEEDEDSKHY